MFDLIVGMNGKEYFLFTILFFFLIIKGETLIFESLETIKRKRIKKGELGPMRFITFPPHYSLRNQSNMYAHIWECVAFGHGVSFLVYALRCNNQLSQIVRAWIARNK